jgi:hypothetical protein
MLKTRKNHLLIEFFSEEDGGEWEEGEAWLEHLLPIREELLQGDYRSLMIAWLQGVQYEDYAGKDRLPPLPPGMGELSGPQQLLCEFLRVDHRLIKAAGALGGGEAPVGPSSTDYEAWLSKVPEADKNQFLLGLLTGDEIYVRAELLHRFQQSQREFRKPAPGQAVRITVDQLLDKAD